MQIFGIGIDVVEVARIARAIQRHGQPLLARLFTADERAYCQSRKIPPLHYAARFAAKEAVGKALGTGIGGHAAWLDLEVAHDSGGGPQVRLSGAAAAFAQNHGITEIKISLTHARDYAAANAIALVGPGCPRSMGEP